MKTRILAIDRDLEHYLRVVITSPEYYDLNPQYLQKADVKADELIMRYGLENKDEDYDLMNDLLESILQAQKEATVKQ